MHHQQQQRCDYRCYGRMDRRGRWRTWRFGPATEAEHARQAAEAAAAGYVLFASVQWFASPNGVAGTTRWTQVREQYTGEQALPHIAPLYFDIDCDGDLDTALLWARELVNFFTEQLELPEPAVRVWFSGAKGAHVLVDPVALGIQPSATLTADMKAVTLALVQHLTGMGTPAMTIDSSVYSLPRMLRLPDQPNPKSGRYKIELSHRELFEASAEQILKLAGGPRGPLWTVSELPTVPTPEAAQWWAAALARARQPREFRIKTAQVAGLRVRPDGYVVDELATTTMPPCIKGIFDAHVASGSRNRCELQIACWAKAAKKPYGQALAMLSAWTDRNRPELSAENAHRKADSILRSVYANPSYGFSCAAARSAARAAGVAHTCGDCQAVRPHHQRQIHSLRVRHDAQWSPLTPITLEDARGLVAAAIDKRIISTAGSAFRRPTACRLGDRAAGGRQDTCDVARLGEPRHTSRLCRADA